MAYDGYRRGYVSFAHFLLYFSTIFAVLRGHNTRKKVVPIIRHRHKAAVKIQSHVRGYFARKSVHQQQSKEHSSAIMIQKGKYFMGRVMRKPDFCICENKNADQLRGDREADQRLCFRHTYSTIPRLPIHKILSL